MARGWRSSRLGWIVGASVAVASAGGPGTAAAQTSGALQARARVEAAQAGGPVLALARTLADSARGRSARVDAGLATVIVARAPAPRAAGSRRPVDRPRRVTIQYLRN